MLQRAEYGQAVQCTANQRPVPIGQLALPTAMGQSTSRPAAPRPSPCLAGCGGHTLYPTRQAYKNVVKLTFAEWQHTKPERVPNPRPIGVRGVRRMSAVIHA
jgi:hypothetical protein